MSDGLIDERAGERSPDPSTTTDTAGPGQAAVLLGASCLAVLGSVLIAPVLPRMITAFAGTPGVDVLVPIVLTVPALCIGLTAPFAGRIVDAAGRKRILVVALVVYAVFGTAPLWLDSLPLIIASRVGVGLAEAAVMTACTTLIADHFSGARRDRYLGLQTVATTLAATVFFGVGGALGAVSWRAPFWLYLSSLVFAVLVAAFVTTPTRTGDAGARLPRIPWALLAVPCAVTLFGGVVFYTPIAMLSLVLDGIGVTSVGTIGLVSAVASLATAAGAFVFGRVSRRGTRVLLPIALVLAGIGLAVVGLASTVPIVLAGAVVASAGTGLLLPTLLTWALSGLDFAERGRGTGLWTACLFIGQFFCPLVLIGVGGAVGGLSVAVLALGILTVVVAAAAPALAGRGHRRREELVA